MEIKDDVIKVSTATEDAKGQPIEPEEHPAEHSLIMEAPLTFGGETIAQMPGSFDYLTDAGSLAIGLRDRCELCIHWSVERWRQLRRGLEFSNKMDQRQYVNQVRYNLEQYLPISEREKHIDAQTGEVDLEAVLDSMGLCNALTEIMSKAYKALYPFTTFGMCGCPDMMAPDGTSLAGNFKPRDTEAAQAAAKTYDNILKMALGEHPEEK